jgi:hypothetical protein
MIYSADKTVLGGKGCRFYWRRANRFDRTQEIHSAVTDYKMWTPDDWVRRWISFFWRRPASSTVRSAHVSVPPDDSSVWRHYFAAPQNPFTTR